MSVPDPEHEKLLAMVDKHLLQLSEHFDAVQIIATRHRPGADESTDVIKRGTGNWYARYGAAVLWIEEHKAREAEQVRREDL